MANSRTTSLRTNAHLAKRQRLDTAGSYRDRIEEEDDFEIVHSRGSHLTSRGLLVDTPRSPQKGRTTWVVGETWTVEDDPEVGLDPAGAWYDEELEKGVMEPPRSVLPQAVKTKARSRVSRRPHVVWKDRHREAYLEEVLRWEGRGDFRAVTSCPDCVSRRAEPPGEPGYRCLDCFLPDLVCRSCCVRHHRAQPFHHVESWTGTHFVKKPLKDLGLRIQLNHVSMHCSSPVPAHSNLRVLHNNGIHDVSIDYCNCERKIARHLQLLRRGLYPASQVHPKTCASFSLLKQLHLLSLTTKGSTYDYYRMLEKLTNNTGINLPKSRYPALLRLVLQWRHLKMLKRGGRGNDPLGAAGTKDGELAVQCPSCPHPGINLPLGWEDASPETRFLYMLIRCIDANFRLKNQLVSSYSADPGLGIGMAYMVPREPYETYLRQCSNDADVSTCVGFSALARANTRFSRGLRTTGVGAVSCGRSEMLLPNAVGDLQKGERYANMDYVVGSSLRQSTLLFVILSYDIACQWFVNLTERMKSWPESIRIPMRTKTRAAIPKLHAPGHNKENHEQYSLNFVPGVGLTDGECPERIWAHHNALGNATKTQGPGSRQDVLDDHFGFWNWQKYAGMGATLMRRYRAAVRNRNIQVEGHRGFTFTLPSELVDSWQATCVAWECAPNSKETTNPYHVASAYLTEATVQKELAEQEDLRIASGGVALHQTSPLAFLVLGMELEDSQRRVQRLAKDHSGGATAIQDASLAEHRGVLRTRIRNWEQVRALYMPGLPQFLQGLDPDAPSGSRTLPEAIRLWLPSSLPAEHRDGCCVTGLPQIEEQLRVAQCGDALEGVRHILRIKSRMVLFKNKNVRGQTHSTRSRAVIDRVHLRAKSSAEKYRVARTAKMALSGPGPWEDAFRILLDSDIRSYSDPNKLRQGPGRRGTVEDDMVGEGVQGVSTGDGGGIDLLPEPRTRRDGTGETRRTLSWIWVTEAPSDGQANDDILRSEWAKSRARSARAVEETLLLREEMWRVLVFLEWKSTWWLARVTLRPTSDGALAEGLTAYAYEQSHLQRKLHTHFLELWQESLEEEDTDGTGGAILSGTGGTGAGTPDEEDSEDNDEEELRDVGDDEYNAEVGGRYAGEGEDSDDD